MCASEWGRRVKVGHEYELYLAIENIDHTRTKACSQQTKGICERFNETVLNEFYRVVLRRTLYTTIEELQADLDDWMRGYNEDRPPTYSLMRGLD